MALSSSRRHGVLRAAAAAAAVELRLNPIAESGAAAVIVHGTYTSTSMKATNSCRLTGESVL